MQYTMKALMVECDVREHAEELSRLRQLIGRSFGIGISKYKYQFTLVLNDSHTTYDTIEELIQALEEMI